LGEGRYDVLVVGGGPAGSVAALELARGGARVALVDKARFPRDKACGDLVGPRGVQLLDDLGVKIPGSRQVGDMIVVGPTGRRVRLPCRPGVTYPGYGFAAPRVVFDEVLQAEAESAGAEVFVGRAGEPLWRDGELDGFELSSGARLCADVVIGADGATSRVADVAGLVDPTRVLWGFALRAYVDDPVTMPHIVLWESEPGRGFPGYGWLFPGVDGRANIGLGLGMLSDRGAGGAASQRFAAFAGHLRRLDVLQTDVPVDPREPGRLGGWLKMGMLGTIPGHGRVLLVGDAAGLVNPLQGEGIAQAMVSGRAAAEAVLSGPGDAALRYRRFLRDTYAPYAAITAPVHAALLPRPRAIAAVGRVVTAPGLSRALAGGWAVFWNDLLAGATPGPPRTVASVAARLGRAITARSRARAWFVREALVDTTAGRRSVVRPKAPTAPCEGGIVDANRRARPEHDDR
jgi:geranylgeranyl reductase family protein